MFTMSNVAAPSERPCTTAAAPTIVVRSHRTGSLVWKLLGLCVIASLSGFNAWWYWRETRALPDLQTVLDWMQHEQYAQAELVLREHLQQSPYDGELRMMLARALAGRGDLLSCAQQLHEVSFWWPGKAEALYREGQSYIKMDRAKDAEASWLELIKDDPLHPVPADLFQDACQELLKIYAIEDRWEDAYPVMWTAYDHAATVDHAALLAMRMRPELERIAPKESIEVIKRYVAAAADDWEALRALANAEEALGRPAEAARHFQECLKGRPDDIRAWRDYLAMLLQQGDTDSFLVLLEQAPKLADTEAETWMFRGVASEKAKDWQAASEHFRKAIELNPTVPKYYYRLAMAEERLGLRTQALAHLERTKAMNNARAQLTAAYAAFFAAQKPGHPGAPDFAAACRHLGSICETMGWSRVAQAWNRLAISP
jgi:tetratricopeptide (TPR) repeat protein